MMVTTVEYHLNFLPFDHRRIDSVISKRGVKARLSISRSGNPKEETPWGKVAFYWWWHPALVRRKITRNCRCC